MQANTLTPSDRATAAVTTSKLVLHTFMATPATTLARWWR